MASMTQRRNRERIRSFIVDFYDVHGYAPTVRDVMQGTGFLSTSSVHAHIRTLARDGVIVKTPRGYMPCQ